MYQKRDADNARIHAAQPGGKIGQRLLRASLISNVSAWPWSKSWGLRRSGVKALCPWEAEAEAEAAAFATVFVVVVVAVAVVVGGGGVVAVGVGVRVVVAIVGWRLAR